MMKSIRRSLLKELSQLEKLLKVLKQELSTSSPATTLFIDIIVKLPKMLGDFVFQNPRSRKPGNRYTNETLNIVWKKAYRINGETIDLYSGLKHSSCSQYINEKGLSISELQIITDHKRLDSVRKYAKVEVARKRALMKRSTKEQAKSNIVRLKR